MSDYSVWALEYGKCEVFPKSSALYLYAGQETTPLFLAYYLIQGNGHNVLVDCGHSANDYQRGLESAFGWDSWTAPETVLAEVGLTPGDIDIILATHIHFDHLGNVGAFPNAIVYVQSREVSEWMRWLTMPKHLQLFSTMVDPQTMVEVAELAVSGRLRLLDGIPTEVLPGISLHPAHDTHTHGSQWILLDQGDEGSKWVFAGDTVLSYENVEGANGDGILRPVGYALGSQSIWLLAVDEMLKAVDRDTKHMIPGHEFGLTRQSPSRGTSSGMTVTEVTLARGRRPRSAEVVVQRLAKRRNSMAIAIIITTGVSMSKTKRRCVPGCAIVGL